MFLISNPATSNPLSECQSMKPLTKGLILKSFIPEEGDLKLQNSTRTLRKFQSLLCDNQGMKRAGHKLEKKSLDTPP